VNAKTKALWVFSIFLVISAFVFFPSVASLLMLLAAVAAIPISKMQLFFAQRGLKGPVKVVFIVVLFVASCFLAPTGRGPSSDTVLKSPAVTASSAPELAPTPTHDVTPSPTPTPIPTPTPTPVPTPSPTPVLTPTPAPASSATSSSEEMVWVSGSGKRYHNNPDCSGMKNPRQIPISEAIDRNLSACANCY